MNRRNNSTRKHGACAACKHQRKKCEANCVLAPYFPADKSREFQAVHKLFGFSNVLKLLTSLPIDRRQLAADSVIWEALCRQNDPVLGALAEFKKIEEQLLFFKAQILSQNLPVQAVPPMTTNNQALNYGINDGYQITQDESVDSHLISQHQFQQDDLFFDQDLFYFPGQYDLRNDRMGKAQ